MESRNDHALLLCDEDPFLSSSTPSPRGHTNFRGEELNSSYFPSNYLEECDHALENYLRRESSYKPVNGYLEKLNFHSELRSARFRAVRWIIMARDRLGLQYGTIFAAVNFLDRFVSMNCHIHKWQVWMMELISIACLSIASKADEVLIPSLHDLQTDDLENTYQPSTIERMELAILKAIDWRVACITSYSYIDLMISHMTYFHSSLRIRTIELLLTALLESKFVHNSASAILASALQLSIEEITTFESDGCRSILENLMPIEHKVEIENCRKIMKERIADPYRCPTSPNTVIPTQRTMVSDRYVDIDTCFLFNKYFKKDFESKKRKHDVLDAVHPND